MWPLHARPCGVCMVRLNAHVGRHDVGRSAVLQTSTLRHFSSSTTLYADNHYTTLGITNKATAAEVKEAYKTLARRYHPDLLPPTALAAERSAAHQQLVKLNAAVAVLGVEAKRRHYDMTLHGPANMYHGQTIRPAYATAVRTAAPAADSDGFDADGFFRGEHTAKREKIVSDAMVVVLAVAWMVVGIGFHMWRFGEAHAEVTDFVEENNRKASTMLVNARRAAQENGAAAQLANLRRQHGVPTQTPTTTIHAVPVLGLRPSPRWIEYAAAAGPSV
eukprot:m.32976 g.32976  ORF g.32976 m.32976 type:complete len:276 (-) comp4957_c1_seq1:86-913(-)